MRYTFYSIQNVSATAPTGSTTLLSGSIALYEFEEVSGSTMYDATGAHNGSFDTGVSISQSAALGLGYSFTGASTSDATIPDHDDLSFTDNKFTIAFWINCPLVDSYEYIMNKFDNSSNCEWDIFFYQNGTISLRKYHGGGTTYIGATSTAGAISASVDSFVVVTSEGNNYGDIRMWVNNDEKTTSDSGTTGAGITNTTKDVWIGIKAGNGWGEFVISQLGFWNRPLSPSEISDLYNSGSGLTYTNW